MARDLTHIKVGDELLLRDANERHGYRSDKPFEPPRVRVTKVGRKLLYVERTRTGFERTTGRGNDHYGHEWVQTEADYALRLQMARAWERLQKCGLTGEHGCRLTPEQVIAIADAVEAIVGVSDGP